MKQALAMLEEIADEVFSPYDNKLGDAILALRAAIEQAQEPVAFDHGIGIDRFKVVRGAFWWHVLIGDSPTEHGKFRSRVSAEKMAADLLREFRNGAFVQHTALRQWQGLTDDEKNSMVEWAHPDIIDAIELKLRERNHG